MPWFIAEYFTIFLVTTLFHDVETIINNNFMYDYDFQKKEREKKKTRMHQRKMLTFFGYFSVFSGKKKRFELVVDLTFLFLLRTRDGD